MSKTLFVPVMLALASCSTPARIQKEPAEQTPVLPATVEIAPPSQGGLAEAPPVETKSEQPSISAKAPHHVEKAPAPGAKDWESADTIAVREKTCDVRRIDSFVRVKCAGGNRVEQLAGDTKSVSFGCYDNGDPKCAVFRLEPGERRVVQFSDANFQGGGGWEGGGFALDKVALVSAWWPKGATEPKISVD